MAEPEWIDARCERRFWRMLEAYERLTDTARRRPFALSAALRAAWLRRRLARLAAAGLRQPARAA